MRLFVLQRDEDVSGVSGTGVVAEGLEFTDGSVVLRWCGDNPTSVVFHDKGIESVKKIHGHGGRTRIVFLESMAQEHIPTYDSKRDGPWERTIDSTGEILN